MSNLARRAHPFTTGGVALSLAAMALLAPPPHGTIAIYAITIVLALVGGVGRGVVLGALVCAPLWVLLFIMHGVLGEGERTARFLGIALSASGVDWALEQGVRLGAVVTASLAFAQAFDPHRFLQAAIARRWRFDLAFLIVATLDAATRLGEQARRLREAQRTRGLRVSGTLATRARALPALVLPLMLVSLTEADDRALALETRGLTLPGLRTPLDPPRDTGLDRLARIAALTGVVACAWWRFS